MPLASKSSLETVDRYVDWSERLAGDVITASTFTRTAGTVTLTNPMYGDDSTVVTIAGGAVGETATITNVITTAGGQTLDLDLSIYIGAAIGPYGPSTGTKGMIVELAYEEIGSAGYQFDHGADEKASTLRKLDLLMADPGTPQIGYNAPAAVGTSDVLDAAGIPDSALQTVAIMLGMRIAPSWGKSMSAETRKALNQGLNALRTMANGIPAAQLRAGTPVGQGNKRRSLWSPFIRRGEGNTVYVSG